MCLNKCVAYGRIQVRPVQLDKNVCLFFSFQSELGSRNRRQSLKIFDITVNWGGPKAKTGEDFKIKKLTLLHPKLQQAGSFHMWTVCGELLVKCNSYKICLCIISLYLRIYKATLYLSIQVYFYTAKIHSFILDFNFNEVCILTVQIHILSYILHVKSLITVLCLIPIVLK